MAPLTPFALSAQGMQMAPWTRQQVYLIAIKGVAEEQHGALLDVACKLTKSELKMMGVATEDAVRQMLQARAAGAPGIGPRSMQQGPCMSMYRAGRVLTRHAVVRVGSCAGSGSERVQG